MDLIWPQKDYLTIDNPIKMPEYVLADGSATTVQPVEFMICRRKEWKTLMSNLPYLKNFVGPTQTRNLNQEQSQLMVLAENEEVANYLVDQ